jgi:GTP cyclohydrolase II
MEIPVLTSMSVPFVETTEGTIATTSPAAVGSPPPGVVKPSHIGTGRSRGSGSSGSSGSRADGGGGRGIHVSGARAASVDGGAAAAGGGSDGGSGGPAQATVPLAPLVRVHDACFTSEVFGSLKCDCKDQLNLAISRLHREPGAVIYMPQEGRGIGLGNKVRTLERATLRRAYACACDV